MFLPLIEPQPYNTNVYQRISTCSAYSVTGDNDVTSQCRTALWRVDVATSQ
jgi:hypothetical protein